MKYKDYIGGLIHLRRGAEYFCLSVLRHNKVPMRTYSDLDLNSSIMVIQDEGFLLSNQISILHEIRKAGNEALHPEIDNKSNQIIKMTNQEAYRLLGELLPEYRHIVNNWMKFVDE